VNGRLASFCSAVSGAAAPGVEGAAMLSEANKIKNPLRAKSLFATLPSRLVILDDIKADDKTGLEI
jgi:hypothetical protein